MGIRVEARKRIVFLTVLTLLCIVTWLYTFFGPTQMNSITSGSILPFLYLRLGAFLVGFSSGIIALISLIWDQHYSARRLYFFQVFSIIGGVLSLLTLFTYIPSTNSFLFTKVAATEVVGMLLALLSLLVLPFGLTVAAQRRQSLILAILNCLVLSPYIFWGAILLFLLGIGFGPPS